MRRANGFTLIELVVTVAIVGVLASIAVPLGELSAQRAKEQELRLALRQIREALDSYKRAVDEGHVVRRVDGSGYPRALDELAEGVLDAQSPAGARIYFLRRLPRDPFHPGNKDIPAADSWGKRAYASPPDDPRDGEDVFDVFTLAQGKGINGRPYREW